MGELSDKTFLGGLDQDTDPRFVDRQDIVDALNIRWGITDQDSQGSIENVRGNLAISVPFPSEVINNICVGAYENLDTKKIYFFTLSLSNENGSCIFEYDQLTDTNSLVLSDATVNGTPSLKFKRTSLINHIDVIDGKFLYWTDGNNPPRKINIERAKTNGYPVPFTEQYIEAAQYAPTELLIAKYGSDSNRKNNDLRGKLFQFSYSYIYQDNEESATSSVSKLIVPVGNNLSTTENLSVVPPGAASTIAPDPLEKNNFIELLLFTGTGYVKKINLYVRIGNTSDWLLAETIDKEKLNIPNDFGYVYRFYNDRILLPANQNYVNRSFDEVPLKANTQAFIDGNRLAYGGITEGFDNIDVDVQVSVVYGPNFPPALRTFLPVKTLKRNSDYGVGLVYYDAVGRSTFVQASESMTFHVLSDFETTSNRGAVGIDLTINHTVPTNFTAYEIVLTESLSIEKFITFTLSNDKIFAPSIGPNNDKIIVSLEDLSTFRGVTSPSSLVYSFIEGDRIRLRYGPNKALIPDLVQFPALTEPVDLEIREFSDSFDLGGGNTLNQPAISFTRSDDLFDIFFGGPGVGFNSVTTVTFEIYTPRLTQAQSLYYTIGERLLITDGFHQGRPGFQTPGNPAQVGISGTGDAYLRLRFPFEHIPNSGPTIEWPITETPDFSDYYISDDWDRGRSNVVDENQVQIFRPTTVRYSEPFVFDTEINGLSTFLNASFRDYDQRWGSIQRMYAENKRIIMFQELKVSQVLVNENILFDTDNQVAGTVGQQTLVLNNNTYYSGEFGIGTNPESFAVYGNVKYFVDAPRGAVLRLSQDGITKISDYKMHNFFTDRFKDVIRNGGYYIHGVYDVRFEEYILSFARTIIDPVGGMIPPSSEFVVTIGFGEVKNRWLSRYSYEPEYMVQTETDIMTFRMGVNYIHNRSFIYNTFYNVTTPNSFTYIENASPQFVKAWQSLVVKGIEAGMISMENERGQVSVLDESDFENREGRFYASFLRDSNTPNVANPLFEGDQLRSDYLQIKYTKQSLLTSFSRTFMITTQFRGSNLLK